MTAGLSAAGDALRRLAALLLALGGLAGGAVSDNTQFPAYASLMPAQSVFSHNLYAGENGIVLLDTVGQFTVAELYVPDVHSIRTYYMEDPSNGLFDYETLDVIAGRVGAVYMVNGDYYSSYSGKTAVRNGRVLDRFVTVYDLCVLYEDGSMRTFSHGELTAGWQVDNALQGAWQAWSFGPVLLSDGGSAIPDFSPYTSDYFRELHARTAIGYYSPGHYCIVSADDSPGVSLEELSAFFEALGCVCAFNLDGGDSTHLWFQNRYLVQPDELSILPDAIYLANGGTP